MKFCLIIDILLLLESFEKFRDIMFEKYKLDPSWPITTHSSSLKCKKKTELLTKINAINKSES